MYSKSLTQGDCSRMSAALPFGLFQMNLPLRCLLIAFLNSDWLILRTVCWVYYLTDTSVICCLPSASLVTSFCSHLPSLLKIVIYGHYQLFRVSCYDLGLVQIIGLRFFLCYWLGHYWVNVSCIGLWPVSLYTHFTYGLVQMLWALIWATIGLCHVIGLRPWKM